MNRISMHVTLPSAKNFLRCLPPSAAGRITYCHALLFAAALPLDAQLGEVVLVSFCLHTLIHLERGHGSRLHQKKLLFLAAPFFLTLLSIPYAPDAGRAFNDLGKQASILILPVLFLLWPLDWK